MAKAQNPDVIEIGSSSVEELSRDDESPSKIMMMSTKGTFYFKILNSKYHKTKYDEYSWISPRKKPRRF